ncbi:15948_t:CDS:2 [Acaulospora morrowiae]|uniref:15948_t:CDS:1 n=1 Tax=Acaulospora morrowiae TaxID=94023 RepID=A0A9N8V8T5_9GLOM|nr:15948_t:CDS:2 [Acaulospora morrowiae]
MFIERDRHSKADRIDAKLRGYEDHATASFTRKKLVIKCSKGDLKPLKFLIRKWRRSRGRGGRREISFLTKPKTIFGIILPFLYFLLPQRPLNHHYSCHRYSCEIIKKRIFKGSSIIVILRLIKQARFKDPEEKIHIMPSTLLAIMTDMKIRRRILKYFHYP